MSAFFVTGTGTGIGKTFTTCALLHAHTEVRGYKPVISGYDEADAESDTARIAALTGEEKHTVSPWRFAAPLSPDMAAAKENRHLALGELVDWTEGAAAQPRVLIETVGGIMVPLNSTHTVRDWMAAANLPLIVVAGSYLGAISHTLTTLEALRAVKIQVAALVINESVGSSVDLLATADSIAAHAADIPLILAQPRVAAPAEASIIHSLWEHLA